MLAGHKFNNLIIVVIKMWIIGPMTGHKFNNLIIVGIKMWIIGPMACQHKYLVIHFLLSQRPRKQKDLRDGLDDWTTSSQDIL